MTIDARGTKGRAHAEPGGPGHGDGPTTRRRILEIALSLMSQRGVDGTSMRDLASAAGLNVASLYHYFPSKRELLEAVLVEQGYLPITAPPGEDGAPAPDLTLAEMLSDYMHSMFEVEDFVRLMVGEAMRGEVTARTVGLDLFSSFQSSLEEWIADNRPDLVERHGAPEVARVLERNDCRGLHRICRRRDAGRRGGHHRPGQAMGRHGGTHPATPGLTLRRPWWRQPALAGATAANAH